MNLILIIGGARAGKSTQALKLAAEFGNSVCFIATAEALDDEMKSRIERHRAERPAEWITIEEPKELAAALLNSRPAKVVIIDCLTLFVSNWLMTIEGETACDIEVNQVIDRFLTVAERQDQTIICVTNEVGLGLVPDSPVGRAFREILGRVNQRLAAVATRVCLMVAGLSLEMKGKSRD